MLGWARRFSLFVVMIVLVGAAFPRVAFAAVACGVTVSPSNVAPGTEAVLQFDIQNSGSQAITWIQVQRPDVNYSINGISQSGWTDASGETGTTLTGSSLAPGDTYSFQLAMQTGPNDAPAATWTISTSQSGDGSGAVGCGGQTTTSIGTPQAPPPPSGESNIGLTNLSATTATVGWTSDVASSSYVYYGTDTGYGKTATAPNVDFGHSVLLTGLSPNTIYHYQVAGSDGNGNNFFSDDNMFITPEAPVIIIQHDVAPVVPSVGGDFIHSAHSTVVVAPTPSDTTAPTASLVTKLANYYATPPTLQITAHDDHAIARVDYSIDGGRNWLPADAINGLGTPNATARFTPTILDDGNYVVMVRAIDGNGNIGRSDPQTLVIDRLPPRFGNLVVAFGSQVLEPDASGSLAISIGSEYRVTGQTVGGATAVQLRAKSATGRTISFSLAQDATTGLWNGAVSFEKGGIYELTVHALDGAGNQTDRRLGQASVVPAGRVVNAQGQAVKGASVTLLYMEPSSGHWTVWDGQPYGQTNPQPVLSGSYSLMAPAGEYYLRASAPGYSTVVSRRFTITSPQSLTAIFKLRHLGSITLGRHTLSVPSWTLTNELPVRPITLLSAQNTTALGNVPKFELPKLSGGSLQSIDLRGRPTVISLLNTWSPSSVDQLPALEAAQQNGDVGIVPIFEGERAPAVAAWLQLSGAKLDGLADPDNTLSESLVAGFGPRHIFIDRSGHIKKVMVGVLSEQTILRELGGL